VKSTKVILTIAILLISFAGGGFYAGMKYQESKRPQGPFGNFQARQFSQRQGTRPINGEIISFDDKSITVKLADNSSKIILLTESTIINKSSEASREDLKKGEKVVAFGTENSDGSITAQNIQLNPILRGRFGEGSSAN